MFSNGFYLSLLFPPLLLLLLLPLPLQLGFLLLLLLPPLLISLSVRTAVFAGSSFRLTINARWRGTRRQNVIRYDIRPSKEDPWKIIKILPPPTSSLS